jgi:hypothetical protein
MLQGIVHGGMNISLTRDRAVAELSELCEAKEKGIRSCAKDGEPPDSLPILYYATSAVAVAIVVLLTSDHQATSSLISFAVIVRAASIVRRVNVRHESRCCR